MNLLRLFVTTAALTASALVPLGGAQLNSSTVARGLRNPVAVVADPSEPGSLLIVEQHGQIRVVRDGVLLDAPFLDLRAEVSTGGERGLLGLVLAPDYVESRRFFVNFTNTNGDTVVARFKRSQNSLLAADPASRFDLMWPDGRRHIEQPFANHNGGHLAFGPDGYLYIGMGDGGSGGDPRNHAQNPQSLLGKMLRLDVNVDDADLRGYRAPEDNPFIDGDPVSAAHEIWSFGVRNPWRFSFDDWTRGGTAALLLADVGQDSREEINFEPSGHGGRNYGWRIREGRAPYDSRTSPAFGPLIDPIHDYGRSIGASVTGGIVYRGAALDPSINGRYFYADFISGRVFSIGLHLHPLTSDATADDEREHTQTFGGREALGMVSSFGQDHDGEMLILNYSAGTVVRIVPDLSMVPMTPVVSARVERERVALSWTSLAGSVEASGYAVERVQNGGVSERIIVERPEISLEISGGECLRVRGISRSGASGPPSAPVCPP